jgi:hypothetical protein
MSRSKGSLLRWETDDNGRYLAFGNASDTTPSVESPNLPRARTHSRTRIPEFWPFCAIGRLSCWNVRMWSVSADAQDERRLTWYIDRPRSIGSSDLSSRLHWRTILNYMLGSAGEGLYKGKSNKLGTKIKQIGSNSRVREVPSPIQIL